MLRAAFWFGFLPFAVAACRPAPSGGATGQSATSSLSHVDRISILKADSAFVLATGSGNLDSVAVLYAEDGSLLPPNEPVVTGREAIRKSWGRFLDAYTVRFELGTDELEGRGDLAYVRRHYTLTASPKLKGAAAISDQGKFVEVLRRQADGKWRFVIDIYNSDLPPMPRAR